MASRLVIVLYFFFLFWEMDGVGALEQTSWEWAGDGILLVKLDRPAMRNAYTMQMAGELQRLSLIHI